LAIIGTLIACAAFVATARVHADSMLAQSAPSVSGEKGTVLKDKINVRARPSTTAEVVAHVNKGDTLDVVGRETGKEGGKPMQWLRVALPAGAQCYVSSKFVKNGAVAAAAVNVRCGPGTSYKDIGKLASGEKVEVVGTHGEWTQIKPTPHCAGWIAAEFVEVVVPAAPPAASAPEITTPPVALPLAPMPAAMKPGEPEPEVAVRYVVKDGILKAVKDESSPPASYELRTEEVGGRSYRIAYLDTTEKNLVRYEGKHVRVFGNERWRKTERDAVIAVERIDMVW